MSIKVKRQSNILDSPRKIPIRLNNEEVDELGIGEEKMMELPAETAEFTVVPVFEKVEDIPVKDGDVVMVKRYRLHYILQFITLILAMSPGVMMAINIETWPYLIFFILAAGVVVVIDLIIKTHHIEVIDNTKTY